MIAYVGNALGADWPPKPVLKSSILLFPAIQISDRIILRYGSLEGLNMNNPRFGFWLNAFFAVVNLGLFAFTPFDFVSPFNLFIGIFCAWAAYQNREHA
jgi:hypothetical protein